MATKHGPDAVKRRGRRPEFGWLAQRPVSGSRPGIRGAYARSATLGEVLEVDRSGEIGALARFGAPRSLSLSR